MKRGLSKIIKTLIFLFVAVLLIMASFIIIKVITSEGFANFLLGTSRVKLKIISVTDTEEGINVNVKRSPGRAGLVGIKFLVSDGVEEMIFIKNATINETENKTFDLEYGRLLKKISIFPIMKDEEKRVVGKIADEKEFSNEEIITGLDGLVSWWKFDGDARDEIGTNNGIAEGVVFADGKDGKASEFDGIDDYIEFNNPKIKNSMSVEFWYNRKALDPSNSDGIIGNLNWAFFVSSREGWGIKHPANSNALNFVLETGDGGKVQEITATSNPLEIMEWYYIVCIFDYEEGKTKLYVNGEFRNSADVPAGYKITESSSMLKIGYSPAKGYFNGKIDEMRIYDRVLSESEIRALYNLY